jgi:hypothetical protein
MAMRLRVEADEARLRVEADEAADASRHLAVLAAVARAGVVEFEVPSRESVDDSLMERKLLDLFQDHTITKICFIRYTRLSACNHQIVLWFFETNTHVVEVYFRTTSPDIHASSDRAVADVLDAIARNPRSPVFRFEAMAWGTCALASRALVGLFRVDKSLAFVNLGAYWSRAWWPDDGVVYEDYIASFGEITDALSCALARDLRDALTNNFTLRQLIICTNGRDVSNSLHDLVFRNKLHAERLKELTPIAQLLTADPRVYEDTPAENAAVVPVPSAFGRFLAHPMCDRMNTLCLTSALLGQREQNWV